MKIKRTKYQTEIELKDMSYNASASSQEIYFRNSPYPIFRIRSDTVEADFDISLQHVEGGFGDIFNMLYLEIKLKKQEKIR